MNMYEQFSFASGRLRHKRCLRRSTVHLPWGFAMKKFILMTLVTATALSPVATYAAEIVPQSVRASANVEVSGDFQRGDREERGRGGRGRSEARGEEQRGERGRGERGQGQVRAGRIQQAPAADIRAQRQQSGARIQHRDAQPVARQYSRSRDGSFDRRVETSRNGYRDRNWDRDRNRQVERSYDRTRNVQVDRSYDRSRTGQFDRRYDRRYDRNDDYRGDRWSNNWRNDSRYDWRQHRQRYSTYYRLGRYYAPYRNHRYSRIHIGFFLGSGFYGSRYWINDPYYYRLPLAYGPYRWVRYYDDVLLIDIRNGRVVDVIVNFFW